NNNGQPAMLKTHRGALMALGAAILLAALVFLFVKTAGIDFRHDAQALSLLREMHDLDSHWDDEAVRLSNDFASAQPRGDFAGMPALTEQLRSDIGRRLETFSSRSPVMLQRVATIRHEAIAADPTLSDAALAAEASGRAFMESRIAEEAAWRKFSFHTLGGR